MSPIATVIPPVSAQLPPEVLLRPVESARSRPIEPTTRLRPQQQQRPAFERVAALDERASDPTAGRRRQATHVATYQPARPSAGGFIAQLLSQGGEATEAGAEPKAPPPGAWGRGSEAYRKAGGQPAAYSEEPELFRILA